MAILLPEHAQALIDVDPFGVLSYGDGTVLTPALRQHLLQALATLADVDPWFRSGNWSTAAVAGLSGADMTEGFRSILSKQDTNFSLRMLILNMLSTGLPNPKLANDLQFLVANPMLSYAERSASVDVLFGLEELGETLLTETYKTIGLTVEDLRLKAKIAKQLIGKQLGVDTLAELFRDVLLCKAKVPFDVLYHLSDNVPDNVVCTALDLITECVGKIPPDCIRDDVWGLDREFDNLLCRALEIDFQIEGLRFLSWFECRGKVANDYWSRNTQSIKTIVAASSSTVMRAIVAAIQKLDSDANMWAFFHHLCTIGLTDVDDSLFLKCVVSAALTEPVSTKKTGLYALALDVALRIGTAARDQFELLYTYADGEKELDTVRQVRCFNEFPEWRAKEAQRIKEQKNKQEATRLKNRAMFFSDIVQIKNGLHRNWLGWISQVYFGNFNDVAREASPRERLVVELGEENAALAIEGLLSFITCRTISDITEILEMHGERRYYEWWYAIFAGLNEYVAIGHDILDLDDTYLLSALTIDKLCVTTTWKGSASTQYEHPWKTVLLQRRPDMVVRAYTLLARADFKRSAQHISGLHELLHDAALMQYRPATALALLQEFPSMQTSSLNQLIQVVRHECEAAQFLQVLRKSLSKGVRDDDALTLWLAAGYLVSPSEFVTQCDALEGSPTTMSMLIWKLREFSNFSYRQQKNSPHLTCQQVEKILQWVINLFPHTSPPDGVRTGDTNPSDATDFALKLIALLSSNPKNEAAAALHRLSIEPSASSYLNDFKHAIAQQRVRMIDEQFRQPSYSQTVMALANGRPANIEDLHALMMNHLEDLRHHIASDNIDVFKQFWNTDSYEKIVNPRTEGICRDVLVGLLRAKTTAHEIAIDPEGHMAADKRADIVALHPGMKLVFELKRDYHGEVWVAIQEQLDRLYTRDPEAQGFGIYLVFWFGEKRGETIPKPPSPLTQPKTAKEMQGMLQSLVPANKRNKIGVVVLDVSGEIPAVE